MVVGDAETVLSYRCHPEVARYQGWCPETVTEVADHARKMADMGEAIYDQVIQLVVETLETPDPHIIGDVAFTIEGETKSQAELGIALDPDYQRQGYGREATRALVGYLFDNYDLHRIHVAINPANHASRTLIEKIGFRTEGHLKQSVFFKGKWCDEIIMAVLRQEWK